MLERRDTQKLSIFKGKTLDAKMILESFQQQVLHNYPTLVLDEVSQEHLTFRAEEGVSFRIQTTLLGSAGEICCLLMDALKFDEDEDKAEDKEIEVSGCKDWWDVAAVVGASFLVFSFKGDSRALAMSSKPLPSAMHCEVPDPRIPYETINIDRLYVKHKDENYKLLYHDDELWLFSLASALLPISENAEEYSLCLDSNSIDPNDDVSFGGSLEDIVTFLKAAGRPISQLDIRLYRAAHILENFSK